MKKNIQVCLIISLFSPFAIFAEDIIASQQKIGITAAVTPDISLSIRGAGRFGFFLDQLENIPGKFDYTGFNGWQIMPGFEMKLGSLGKVLVIGGGEIGIQKRLMVENSESSWNYFEITPTGRLTLKLPLSEGFFASLENKFDRRMVRSPWDARMNFQGTAPNGFRSSFRYTAVVSILFPDLTPLRVAPMLYYEGMTQHLAYDHLCGWGYGFSIRPSKMFHITFADRIRWIPGDLNKPMGGNSTTHQISTEAEFFFNFANN